MDWAYLGLLLAAFLLMLVLVPPLRSFPTLDDWIYARSVQDFLQGIYRPADWSQATALSHVAWGAGWAAVLGLNFTTLTLATLGMSAAALVLCYVLLRHLAIPPALALLGTALLAANPLFVFLSYSFMTDITLLVLVLAASLCFLHGGRQGALAWWVAGSVLVGLAYLTRQIGLLLLPSLLGYLWWTRQLTWRRAAATILPALGMVGLYTLWERLQPPPLMTYALQDLIRYALSDPVSYLRSLLNRLILSLPVLGLFLLPLLVRPRRLVWAAPIFVAIGLVQFLRFPQSGSLFPTNGNVITHSGFVLYLYQAAPLRPEWIWTGLGIVGAASIALFATAGVEWVVAAWRGQARRDPAADPALFLYGFGAATWVATFGLSFLLFDRYWLPLLPILIIPALRRVAPSWRRIGVRAGLVGVMAVGSLLAQSDYLAHAAARWQVGTDLLAQGVAPAQIQAGYEWSGWWLFEAGARRIRQEGRLRDVPFPPDLVQDPLYVVSDSPVPSYTLVMEQPYDTPLGGGAARHVLLLKRQESGPRTPAAPPTTPLP